MGKKTHFCGELPKEKFVLINVISIDSIKQSGNFLKEFINLVNKNTDKISKIIFLDTTYLNRHYDKKYEEQTVTDWRKSHEAIIRNYVSIEWEIMDWRTVISTDKYGEIYSKLSSYYSKNQNSDCFYREYHEKVIGVANSKKNKGELDARIKYILEEDAGFLSLEGMVTYPDKLNAALGYSYEKFNFYGVKYIKHVIPDSSEKLNQNVYCLPRQTHNHVSFFKELMTDKIEQLNRLPVSQQVRFYRDFESLYDLYTKELRDTNNENIQRKFNSWN